MNEQELKKLYDNFQKGGFAGTFDDYKNLISTDENARDVAYNYAKKTGYTNGRDNFNKLAGVKDKSWNEILSVPQYGEKYNYTDEVKRKLATAKEKQKSLLNRFNPTEEDYADIKNTADEIFSYKSKPKKEPSYQDPFGFVSGGITFDKEEGPSADYVKYMDKANNDIEKAKSLYIKDKKDSRLSENMISYAKESNEIFKAITKGQGKVAKDINKYTEDLIVANQETSGILAEELNSIDKQIKNISAKKYYSQEEVNFANKSLKDLTDKRNAIFKQYENISFDTIGLASNFEEESKRNSEIIDITKRNWDINSRALNIIPATIKGFSSAVLRAPEWISTARRAAMFDGDAIKPDNKLADKLEGWANSISETLPRPIDITDVKSAKDFAAWGIELVANQAPQTALMLAAPQSVASAYILSSSAGSKYQEMMEESDFNGKNYSASQLIAAPAIVGLAELLSEQVTFGQLKPLKAAFKSSPSILEASKAYINSEIKNIVGKNILEEASSEGLAQIAGNLVDIFLLDKKDVSVWDNVPNATASGAFMSSIVYQSPYIGKKMLEPFMPKDIRSKLYNDQLMVARLSVELNNLEKKGSDEYTINEIKNTIEEINKNSVKMLSGTIQNIDNIDANSKQQLIDNHKDRISTEFKKEIILNDENLSPQVKGGLIKSINNKLNKIESEKAELFKNIDRRVNPLDNLSEKELEERIKEDIAKAQSLSKSLGFENLEIIGYDKAKMAEFGLSQKQIDDFKGLGAFFDSKDGKQLIVVNESLAKDQRVVTTAQHEFLHKILNASIKNNPKLAKDLGLKLYNYVSEYVGSDLAVELSEFGMRIDKYLNAYSNGRISESDFFEEVMPLLSESLSRGDIKYSENIISKLGGLIRSATQAMGVPVKFRTGKDIFNFVKDYNKAFAKGKLPKSIADFGKMPVLQDESGRDVSESMALDEALNTKYKGNTNALINEMLTFPIAKSKFAQEIGGLTNTIARRLYDPIPADQKIGITRADFIDALIGEAATMVSREYKGLQNLDKFISSRLNLRANDLASRLGIESSIKEDIEEREDIMADTSADEDIDTQEKEDALAKEAKKAELFREAINLNTSVGGKPLSQYIYDAINRNITLSIRTYTEEVSANRTITPFIQNIKNGLSDDLETTIIKFIAGYQGGYIKFLEDYKSILLFNYTTTYLSKNPLFKKGILKSSGGKTIKDSDGRLVFQPNWFEPKNVAKPGSPIRYEWVDENNKELKIDRDNAAERGLTSGPQIMKRNPDIANIISNDEWINFHYDDGAVRKKVKINARKAIARQISAELGLELLQEDFRNEGPVFQSFKDRADALGVFLSDNISNQIIKDADRGVSKFSLSLNEEAIIPNFITKAISGLSKGKFVLRDIDGNFKPNKDFVDFINNINLETKTVADNKLIRAKVEEELLSISEVIIEELQDQSGDRPTWLKIEAGVEKLAQKLHNELGTEDISINKSVAGDVNVFIKSIQEIYKQEIKQFNAAYIGNGGFKFIENDIIPTYYGTELSTVKYGQEFSRVTDKWKGSIQQKNFNRLKEIAKSTDLKAFGAKIKDGKPKIPAFLFNRYAPKDANKREVYKKYAKEIQDKWDNLQFGIEIDGSVDPMRAQYVSLKNVPYIQFMDGFGNFAWEENAQSLGLPIIRPETGSIIEIRRAKYTYDGISTLSLRYHLKFKDFEANNKKSPINISTEEGFKKMVGMVENYHINNKANILNKANNKSIISGKESKGISVWDFDDTLAKTKSNVLYTMPGESIVYNASPRGFSELGARTGLIFLATDIKEAEAYAKMNDGKVRPITINDNSIATEEFVINKMNDLGIEQDGLLYEMIDPRFDDFYIGDENVNKLKNAIKSAGFAGFTYTDGSQLSNMSTESIAIIDKTAIKETSKIDATEFAAKSEEFAAQGAQFDFSEFSKVTEGEVGPMFEKALARNAKFGNEHVYILTARPSNSKFAIYEFLQGMGLDIRLENIVGLGNGTPQAKADWIVAKVAEGYNDFYFADDAYKNVKAVQDALSVFDIKSDVQQAKAKFSEQLNDDFNDIIEEQFGIESYKRFSEVVGRRRGYKKGRWKLFIPPSAEDFQGLLYSLYGRGRRGELQKEWFDQNLVLPYLQGIANLEKAKQGIRRAYKTFLTNNKGVEKMLKQKISDGDFTYDQAMRVYLWTKAGFEIPGLSQRDQNKLNDIVANDEDLMALATQLQSLSRQDAGWIKPEEYWDGETLLSDLEKLTEGVNRKEYLAEFIQNADIIFSQENKNKLRAAVGNAWVDAMEDSIKRMKSGVNQQAGTEAITNRWNKWISNSVGAIMFLNRRSATLQLLSATNFLNWSDNNPLKAAAAFANQKQYWADWTTIFNSDKLKERRGGLKTDVTESEIANIAAGAKNKVSAVISWLLKIGFTPTQIADSIAIASGGATFYRNRANTYIEQGMSQKDAEAKAFQDFSRLSDEAQQSSDPLLVSKEQSTTAGRLILAFANTPQQYMRLTKKAALDLINGRGNAKTHISKIIYYTAVQNLIFSALQSALFTMIPGFDDDGEELPVDKAAAEQKQIIEVLNSMADSILRGLGIYGAVVSTVKNAAMKYIEESEKDPFKRDMDKVVITALSLSPPIGSKAQKLKGAFATEQFEKDVMEARGWNILVDGKYVPNPRYEMIGKLTAATINLPLDRLYDETASIAEMFDSKNNAWQKLALGMGYKTWQIGADLEENDLIKTTAKKERKAAGKIKAKETRAANKQSKEEAERLMYSKMTTEEIVKYRKLKNK